MVARREPRVRLVRDSGPTGWNVAEWPANLARTYPSLWQALLRCYEDSRVLAQWVVDRGWVESGVTARLRRPTWYARLDEERAMELESLVRCGAFSLGGGRPRA